MTPMFSRGTGMAGKCDAELKVRLPSDVKDDLQRAARQLGMTDADFTRELICIRLYGLDHMCRLHEERLATVAGTGVGMGNTEGIR